MKQIIWKMGKRNEDLQIFGIACSQQLKLFDKHYVFLEIGILASHVLLMDRNTDSQNVSVVSKNLLIIN